MAKRIFQLLIVLVVVLLGYNFFFGTPEEKESSRKVFAKVGELTSSVVDLLKSEKEKFDGGKYDTALAKLKSAIGIEKERATELGQAGRDSLSDCEHLEQEEGLLERQLAELTQNVDLSEEEKELAFRAIRDRILKLTDETNAVANQLDRTRSP